MSRKPDIFRCEVCEATREHRGSTDACGSIDGFCEQLMRAGWRDVTVRIESPRRRTLLIRYGWLCGRCVTRYVRTRSPHPVEKRTPQRKENVKA